MLWRVHDMFATYMQTQVAIACPPNITCALDAPRHRICNGFGLFFHLEGTGPSAGRRAKLRSVVLRRKADRRALKVLRSLDEVKELGGQMWSTLPGAEIWPLGCHKSRWGPPFKFKSKSPYDRNRNLVCYMSEAQLNPPRSAEISQSPRRYIHVCSNFRQMAVV